MAQRLSIPDRLSKKGLFGFDREELRLVPVTDRGERTRWEGIQHGELADRFVEAIDRRGLEIKRESWQVGGNGARLFGDVRLKTPNRLSSPTMPLSPKAREAFEAAKRIHAGDGTMTDFLPTIVGGGEPGIGLVHSNDSSLSLQVVVMLRILVCANGWIIDEGRIAIARKHTTGLDLDEALDVGLAAWSDRIQEAPKTYEALRAVGFDGEAGSRRWEKVLCEAGRRELFPWSKLGKVDEAFRNPAHPEFVERNGWSAYNAFTEVSKGFSLAREMEAVESVRGLILDPSLN